MKAARSVAVTFRISPRTRGLLEAAAAHERRSLTNMFEVLVEDFCLRKGIVEPTTERADSKAARTRDDQ